MLKKTPEAFSTTNIKISIEACNNKVDDSNEISRRKIRKNLSKVNSFEACFFTPEARLAFTRLTKAFISYQFSTILIKNVISGLKLVHLALLLMQFWLSWLQAM